MMLMKKGKIGRRREMRQLGIIRAKNTNARRNKRLQIRRQSVKNKETEMSLSLSLTSSSSWSSSSENYDALEKKACSNTVTCLSHGTMSVIGRRKEMEDAVRVELGFMGGGDGGDDDDDDHQKTYDFFGVYDGHGGTRVAEACKERMHEVLVEVIAGEKYGEKNIEWERAMEGCFGKMDEEVNRARLAEEMVGSTAVVAVVGKEELVVANCGDSRAVLYRGGVVVPLSVDHKVASKQALEYSDLLNNLAKQGKKPSIYLRACYYLINFCINHYDRRWLIDNFNISASLHLLATRPVYSDAGVEACDYTVHAPDRPDELVRVEAAGGRVINWNGPRILGVLATSRSIGDEYLKPFVISKPEVMVTKRSDRDEFLILASDGLWDVVSNEAACQVVRRCFSGRIKWASSIDAGNQNLAARAAAVLVELAISRGSSDNISVIVVELNKPTKFNS